MPDSERPAASQGRFEVSNRVDGTVLAGTVIQVDTAADPPRSRDRLGSPSASACTEAVRQSPA